MTLKLHKKESFEEPGEKGRAFAFVKNRSTQPFPIFITITKTSDLIQ